MPARRVQPSNTSNTLAPQPQALQPGVKPSPSLPSITRSASPSGLSNFFARPTKWFTRSNSGSRPSPTEPRSSTSSTSSRRRPTISGPTDPRPIEPPQPQPSNGSRSSNNVAGLNERASKSVFDLSRASADLNVTSERGNGGLGDLRSISRKGWSKSADNLALSSQPKLAPLKTTSLETRIEQYRTGSPSTPVSSSYSNLNLKAYPFPDANTASPSTPPNDHSLHALSNFSSQTPIVSPSTRLAPPSPQQLGPPRKRSFDFDRNTRSPQSGPQGSRPAFSFYFNSNVSAGSKVASPATPTIVEPDDAQASDPKRASQIIHRAGFINRLQSFSVQSPHLSSNKNWKPFKLVLKGSKLYFYKPPSDRSVAIKDLFPSGLVAVVEEEEGGDGEAAISNTKDERKKRAFWGRRTHPDLTVKDKEIVSGTLDALVHETVFGTTFKASSESNSDSPNFDLDAWKGFASTVLFALPGLVDQQKVDFELQRCVSYLANGASEAERLSELDRIAWLLRRYFSYYAIPDDDPSWSSFCKDTIPSFKISEIREESDDNTGSVSPSPMATRTSSDTGSILSPSHDIVGSLSHSNAANLQAPSMNSNPVSPVRSTKSSTRPRLWSVLNHEGFSREVFLRMDMDTIVQSLLMYHRSLLDSRTTVPADVFLQESSESPLKEFFGSDDSPHWLTRIVVSHILGPGHIREGSGSGTADERSLHATSHAQSHNSRTHIRSEVISRWVRVGELSRHAGDVCTWRAIAAALVSKPVARLEKAWKRVDTQALSAIRSWVQYFTSGESIFKGSKFTPWGGDARQRSLVIVSKLQKKPGEFSYPALKELHRIYEDVFSEFSACLPPQKMDGLSEDEDARRLMQFWKDSTWKSKTKFNNLDQFMPLSYAAEPRRKGLFAPYYWSHSLSTHNQQVLVPLLFPEPLPSVSLIDRSQIVRNKKLSFESGAAFRDSQPKTMLEIKRTFDGNANDSTQSRRRSRMNGLDFGGMILPVFEGELLLSVASNPESCSRPVSAVNDSPPDTPLPNRTPSIRVKSAAAGLDRKSSRARRSSLPSLKHRSTIMTSEQTSEPPLRATVHAGTLDALVHFLIHGLEGVSVSVADDNGEMALSDKKTRSVKVDRAEFASIWWNVFRSFVSPYVLFQLLRKDYMTFHPPRKSFSAEELEQALKERHSVLRTLGEWIQSGGGAQDALDDLELYTAIRSFLIESDDREITGQSTETTETLQDIVRERESLLRMFTALTMRPQSRHVPVRGSSGGTAAHNFGVRSPQIEELTAEELVDNLDAMASAAFRNVVQEDLFVTADLLEVQTADRTGWFLPREPSSFAEDVEIQSMYSYIMEVEPTSLIGGTSGDSLYRLLPPGIRSLIRAYNILRKWAICTVATPHLGLRARQSRMELFLRSIEIARFRNADETTFFSQANPSERPCVRSFVEAVLTSAILSPESRAYSRAWQAVGASRGANAESLLSLLTVRTVDKVENNDRLTVDPAWLLERILEVISMSDVLDSPVETPLSLVNYEKRRQLCNIIINASSFAARGSRQRREMDRCDFERLNRIEQEYSEVQLDLRLLREDAQKEASGQVQSSTPSGKKGVRPFYRSVSAQQEKIKRDRYLRERLIKEKRQEQQRLERKEDDLNRAMDSRNLMNGVSKQHRSKRSMSALFSLMRPISTAFSSESSSLHARRTPAELDFVPSQKPALVISLAEARISPFINNERSFTFQLDTEDGGNYLLQALSRNDMTQWINAIGSTVRNHAQRRLTYLGPSTQFQFSEQGQPRPMTASRDPTAVFGVELEFLVSRENGNIDGSSDAVPRVLEVCLAEIEARGLSEQGIYRIAGATSEVTGLRESLNNGQMYIDRMTDIHAVCGVVKYWFRVLPDSVIPESYFDSIVEAARLSVLDDRLLKIREVVHSFPPAYFSVLRRLVEHLDRVVDYEDKNHMTPDNLATVFCPNLIRAPGNNFALVMKNMGPIIVLFKALITHMHFIFGEAEVEEDDDHLDGDDIPEVQVIPEEEEEEEDDVDVDVDIIRTVSSPEPDESLLQNTDIAQ